MNTKSVPSLSPCGCLIMIFILDYFMLSVLNVFLFAITLCCLSVTDNKINFSLECFFFL